MEGRWRAGGGPAVRILLAACAAERALGFSPAAPPPGGPWTRGSIGGCRGHKPTSVGGGLLPLGAHVGVRSIAPQRAGAFFMQERRATVAGKGTGEVAGLNGGYPKGPRWSGLGRAGSVGLSMTATSPGLAEEGEETEANAKKGQKRPASTGDEGVGVDRGSNGSKMPGGGGGIWPVLLLNLVTVLWGTQHAVIKLSTMDGSGAPPQHSQSPARAPPFGGLGKAASG
jgi:hypothetical protein